MVFSSKKPAWKLIQKQIYDILSHKYSLLIFCLACITLAVSAFHFGESWLNWSKEKYEAVFNSFSDNIAERSLQGKLCQYVPIDIVYTWVNGSDPLLLDELEYTVKTYGQETSEATRHCPYKDCIPSHFLAFSSWLPSGFGLSYIYSAFPSLRDVAELIQVQVPDTGGKRNWTLLAFGSIIEATIGASTTTDSALSNYTLHHVYWSAENTASNGYLVPDTVILNGVHSGLNVDSLHKKLPKSVQHDVKKIWLYSEKGLAVVQFLNPHAADVICKASQNLTIDGKDATVNNAHLILQLPAIRNFEDFSSRRFEDKEELRYSLRSVEKYAPWVRHIYLVTNGQIPYWLNLDNPRLTLVTHEEIFPNTSHLPTFSSPAIESHLHRIPGLSQKFLYLNDDVLFGKEIWPDDFYSHERGQKVYLSWPVPECHEDCPSSWIADGYCDKACNNSDCMWDGGDCRKGGLSALDTEDSFEHWPGDMDKSSCSPHCANDWLADKYCDSNCNTIECGFDAGDCGTAQYHLLHSFQFLPHKQQYALPKGSFAVYWNLTNFLEKATVLDGGYEDSPAVRVLSLSLKFKVLTLILYLGYNDTTVNFSLKTVENGMETEYNISVKACTSVNTNHTSLRSKHPPVQDLVELVARNATSEPATSYEVFEQSNLEPAIVKSSTMDEAAALKSDNFTLREGHFPPNVVEMISQLEQLYEEGELTWNGYVKKKYNIFHDFLTVGNETKQSSRKTNSTQMKMFAKNMSKRRLPKHDLEMLSPVNAANQKTDSIRTFRRMFIFHDSDEDDSPLENILSKETRKDDMLLGPYQSKAHFSRKLLDTFGESLLHVNRLYNRKYGFEARKVPAHMAHMIDREIMEQLQQRFSKEWDITSSHKIRSPTDMQYAFSYFYFLMSEKNIRTVGDIFKIFDTDNSRTWSDREIRTVLTRLFELPLGYSSVVKFESFIMNCSLQLPANYSQGISTPPYERYYDSKLPVVTESLISSCQLIATMLKEKFGGKKKYKYQIVGEEDVTFKMLTSNLSHVISHLDDVRKKPKKFICLNDNMDPSSESENAVVRAVLQDFYESLFPIPSSFELPPEYRNRFLHMFELKSWKVYHNMIKVVTYLCVSGLIIFTVVNFFQTECTNLHRRIFSRHSRPRNRKFRRYATEV